MKKDEVGLPSREEMKKLDIEFTKALKAEINYDGNNGPKQQKLHNAVNKLRERKQEIRKQLWDLYLSEKLCEPMTKGEINGLLIDFQFRTHDAIAYHEKHPTKKFNSTDLIRDLDKLKSDLVDKLTGKVGKNTDVYSIDTKSLKFTPVVVNKIKKIVEKIIERKKNEQNKDV